MLVSDVWERVDQDQVASNLDVWVRKVSTVWPDNIAIPTHGQEPQPNINIQMRAGLHMELTQTWILEFYWDKGVKLVFLRGTLVTSGESLGF